MKHILLSIFLFLQTALFCLAQVTLENDPGITSGKLPNGVEYFLVKNSVTKGYADFAVVQKGRFRRAVSVANLDSLPHFGSVRPYEYLASKGIGYDDRGMISYSPSGATYRFGDVPVFESAVVDSLLLMVFDIVDSYPADQAVIVSGDIDVSWILERMKVLSIVVSPRWTLDGGKAFSLNPSDSIIFSCATTRPSGLASLHMTYFSERIPREDMGTIQPLVNRMFAEELGDITLRRIRRTFLTSGTPLTDVSFRYRGSSEQVEQERYSFNVTVPKDKLTDAAFLMGSVLSEIKEGGITREEYLVTRNLMVNRARENSFTGLRTNAEYIDKCVSTYLFGEAPYSLKSYNEFFASKSLDPDYELDLLNRYARSLYSQDHNLILHFRSPEMLFNRDSMVTPFIRGWKSGKFSSGNWKMQVELPKLHNLSKGKTKIKSIETEPVCGGSIWNFSNGMKVIFKKTDTKGMFHFGFLFNEGYSSVPGMEKGGNVYLAEMLGLSRIAGISGEDFLNAMELSGIHMDCSISYASMQIKGFAPVSRLETLLRSMLTISQDRKADPAAYRDFALSQRMLLRKERFTPAGVRTLLDSLVSPDYPFPAGRYASALTDDFPVKADWYFDKVFGNWANGVIVIAGDFDEAELKKYLMSHINSFDAGSAGSGRNIVERNLSEGESTVSSDSIRVGDGTPAVYVRMTGRIPVNNQRRYALKVAERLLRAELVRKTAPLGMYVGVDSGYEFLPYEMMTVNMFCRKCIGAGLPSSVLPQDIETVRNLILETVQDLCDKGVDASVLKALKARLLQEEAARFSSQMAVIDAVLTRYALAKDTMTGYKQAVEAVSAGDVEAILSALREGAVATYLSK
ncbi:MAG: insulinase family protein [Bacteroidales bacterium]|nr:insulinase family protein [Bacteroidales bacterium]